MRHGLAVVTLALFCAGCTTDIVNQFRGKTCNLAGDARTQTLRCNIPGYCSGPSAAGGQFVGFGLPTQGFSLFIFYPKIEPNHPFVGGTAPPMIDAWLFRSHDYPWSDARECGDLDKLRHLGGERLRGQVAVRWKSNADFSMRVDLLASNQLPVSITGEFVGYSHTKFDPSAPFVGLAKLLFGEGHSVPTPQPEQAEQKR